MSNMSINKMSELCKRGLYSPINYYLGVIALLKEGFDVHYIMSEIPESLLGEIKGFAQRHRDSPTKDPDLQELELTRQILAWGQPSVSPKARNGASTMAAATGNVKSATALTLKVKSGAEQRPKRVQRAAILLKQVSDPTRLQVILLLSEGEKHVGALCRELNQSQPVISHHLGLLRHSGLITPRREGKNNFYSLTDSGEELARVVKGLIADSSELARSRTGMRVSRAQD